MNITTEKNIPAIIKQEFSHGLLKKPVIVKDREHKHNPFKEFENIG
jgi:hypothetical protein